jgi:hypothetical protein
VHVAVVYLRRLRLHSFTTRELIFYEAVGERRKEDKNERETTIRVDDEEHAHE